MDTSSQAKAHSRHLTVSFAVLGCFAAFLVVATYLSAGAAAAAPLAASFLVLGGFAVWGTRRAKIWRTTNPSATEQRIPLSAMVSFKAVVFIVILTTIVMVTVSALFHIL